MMRSWTTWSSEFAPPNATYSGDAAIAFCTPDGEVSGPATVTIAPEGRVTIAVTIQQYAIPSEYHGFLMPFLQGDVPGPTSAGGTLFRNAGGQEIKQVEVSTSVGKFRSERALVTSSHFSMGMTGDTSIEVVPNDLEFAPKETADQDVWCMPLLGNLSELIGTETAFALEDRLPYIAFRSEGAECGLVINEPASTPPSNFSGAAFGVIGAQPHETVEDIKNLLPAGLVAAVKFVSGSDIAVPFLEIRSFQGRLARRLHLRFGGGSQGSNFAALSRFDTTNPDSGVGAFLCQFFQLHRSDRMSLVVSMNLTSDGTPGTGTVDKSIATLVQALDGLCKRHGLARCNLMAGLDAAKCTEVDEILSEARERLKSLRRLWKAKNDLAQLPILDKIISRQANVASEDLDFGIAVSKLLRKFNLHDCDAMNSYYATLPKQVTWEGSLSSVRGQVIHSGAIHIQNPSELLSWFELSRHLHDICKRIIFREIGYAGTYSPTNVSWRGQYKIDRVQSSTTIKELGYTTPPAFI
ncbi:MAG: hypothetical protein LAO04_06640 [Acidobacteriia bacterium]|nr:hypothetical protein [Terriglobia bacterium]